LRFNGGVSSEELVMIQFGCVRLSHSFVAALVLVTATGCGPKIRLADSIDNSFDLAITNPYDGGLDSPYVAGAAFRIYAYDRTEDNDLEGWTIVSLDPAVIELTTVEVVRDNLEDGDKVETDIIQADAVAIGPGTAILEVRDEDGEFVRATEVVVMQPDRIDLRAAGPMFIERDDLAGNVDATPKILANGTATFLVEWYAGEQRLSGAGTLALTSEHPNASNLWARQSFLDEGREWATVEFTSPEAGNELATVSFLANGMPVQDVMFEIVQPDAIDHVELLGESTSGHKEGALLTVLAQAIDLDGESVWGVAFDWDLDGSEETGEGDLFRYWFEPSVSSVLGAAYGEHRGETTIAGDEGFVTSSNNIGCFCSATEVTPARDLPFGLLCLASLGLVRRRREDNQGSSTTPPT
jgi:MYXO-CTERM domain-containing protein